MKKISQVVYNKKPAWFMGCVMNLVSSVTVRMLAQKMINTFFFKPSVGMAMVLLHRQLLWNICETLRYLFLTVSGALTDLMDPGMIIAGGKGPIGYAGDREETVKNVNWVS